MDDFSGGQWSQSQSSSACFVVLDSQEEDANPSKKNHGRNLFHSLVALKTLRTGSPLESESQLGRKQRIAGEHGEEEGNHCNPQEGGDDVPAGQGEAGQDQGEPDPEDHGEGAAGGAGGGDPGGDGGRGDDPEQPREEEEEEEEEHDDSSPPSSNGSIPGLLRPALGSAAPARNMPGHVEHEQQPSVSGLFGAGGDESDDGRHGDPAVLATDTASDSEIQPRPVGLAVPESESEGGISDAPTAVLSDTEVGGFSVRPRAVGPSTQFLSPARSRGSSLLGSPRGLDSSMMTVSSLSSFSSSSSSDERSKPGEWTGRGKKRAPTRRVEQQPKRTKPGASSSSDTSGHKTSDTSGEHGEKMHETSEEVSPSQKDLFEEEQAFGMGERHVDHSKMHKEEDDLVATPAEVLGSLRFSGQPSHESAEEGLGESSQGFEAVPHLLPDSPTAMDPMIVPASQESVVAILGSQEDEDATMKEVLEEDHTTGWESKKPHSPAPRKGSEGSGSLDKSSDPASRVSSRSSSSGSLRPASASLQQWQPSVPISISPPEESVRSVTTPEQEAPVHVEEAEHPHHPDIRSHKTPPEEPSESLHLHMAETEQTGDSEILWLGGPEGDLQDNTAGAHVVQGAEQPESSQELSLHFSPSQPPDEGSQFTFGVSELVSKLESQVDEGEPPQDMGNEDNCELGDRKSGLERETSQGGFHLNILEESNLARGNVGNVEPKNTQQSQQEPESSAIPTKHDDQETTLPPPILQSQMQEDSPCEENPGMKRIQYSGLPPSLTLDMIDTQSQDLSEASVSLFRLEPPTLEAQVSTESQDPQSVSVFKKAREARAKRTALPVGSSSESDDPFDFSGGQELRKQMSFQKLQEKKRQKLHHQRTSALQTVSTQQVKLTPSSDLSKETTLTATEQLEPIETNDETLGEEEIVLPTQEALEENPDMSGKEGSVRYSEVHSLDIEEMQVEEQRVADIGISLGPQGTLEEDSFSKEPTFTAVREKETAGEKFHSDNPKTKPKSKQSSRVSSQKKESQSTTKDSRYQSSHSNPAVFQPAERQTFQTVPAQSQTPTHSQDVPTRSSKGSSQRSTGPISVPAGRDRHGRQLPEPNPNDDHKNMASVHFQSGVPEGAVGSSGGSGQRRDPFEFRDSQSQRDRRSMEQVKNLAEVRRRGSTSQGASGSSGFSSRIIEHVVEYREITTFREEFSMGRYLPPKIIGKRHEVLHESMDVTEEENLSSVSPSRTGSGLSSGDLGDISSSLSRSGGSKSPRDVLSGSDATSGSLNKTSSSSSLTRGHTLHSPTSPRKISGHSSSSSLPSLTSDTFHPEATSTMAEAPGQLSRHSSRETLPYISHHQAGVSSTHSGEDHHLAGLPSHAQTVILSQSGKIDATSSSSLKQSEPLFSSSSVTKSEAGKQQSTKMTSKSTSSSYKPSASLFSTSSDVSLGDQDLFSKPAAPPKKSRSRHHSGTESLPPSEHDMSFDKAEESLSMIPPTDPRNQPHPIHPATHRVTGKGSAFKDESLKVSKGKGRGKGSSQSKGTKIGHGRKNSGRGRKKAAPTEEQTEVSARQFSRRESIPEAIPEEEEQEDADHISPEIPLVGSISSTPSQTTAMLSCVVLDPDTPVLARWKDNHYYPGHIFKKEKSGKFSVLFEDGTRRQVKEGDVIVCDLLEKDKEVYAEFEDGCFYPAIILEALDTSDLKGYLVEFQDGDQQRVERGKVMLQSDQAADLIIPPTQLLSASGTAQASESASLYKTKKEPPEHRPELGEEMEFVCDVASPPMSPQIQSTPPLASLARGTAVLALWQLDRHFYPGHIVSREKGERYTVLFEDGNERPVKESDLIVVDLLEPGTNVFAVLKEDWIQPAVVLDTWVSKNKKGYVLELADNSQQKVLRSDVYLHYSQASEFLVPSACPAPSQIVAARANVTLDNVVAGKRQRSSAQKTDSPSTPGTSRSQRQQIEEKDATPKKSTKRGGTGGKRKLADIAPKATSTPTPKTKKRMLMQQDVGEAPSPLLCDSPQGARKTPRKAKHELFSEIKGPLPSRGSQLFLGMAFLLTRVERTEEQKMQERNILRQESLEASTTDYSTSEEEETIPFDKEHISNQIEQGGGVVLETFDLDKVTTADRCLLLSNTYQRTLKYFHCLAAGIPCVSHVWIRDCCIQETILDYTAYILPAGISLEKRRIMEWSSRGSVLKGSVIAVLSQNDQFCQAWIGVLETCGCNVLHRLPAARSSEQLDVIVADKTISPSHLQRAEQLGISVVSSEWVIQCLINSRIMDTEAHPRYRYDYEGD